MNITMNQLFYSLLLAAILALFSGEVPAQEKNKNSLPKLAGQWNLNTTLSDDVDAKMQEMMKSGGGMPMGGPPSGMMGGGDFPGGGMPSREQIEQMREKMKRSLMPPENVVINQTETEMTIAEKGENERTRTFYFDGRKKEKGETTKAKLKKSQVIIETQAEQRLRIIETYELSKDGKQLIVNVKTESSFGGGLKLRRVYDAA